MTTMLANANHTTRGRSRRAGRASRPQADRGLTLIELVVVMGLIAVLAGLSVGMLKRRNPTLTAEANAKLIRANLRLARNTARAAAAGAFIRIDPETVRLEAFPVSPGGNWHFEDDSGSRATRIRLGGTIEEGGHLGRCLDAGDGGRTDLGSYGWFQPPNGFRFTVWVKPAALDSGTLFRLDGSFQLTMNEQGGLVGTLYVGEQGETVTAETRDGVLRAGRWAEVAMTYDRVELSVEVNGVVLASRAETRPVALDAAGHLFVGGPPASVKGRYDEARYDVVGAGDIQELSTGADFLPDSDLMVRFDGQGRLDRRHHTKPVVIRMMGAQGDAAIGSKDEVVEIRIEMSGVIR